ncbi:unnamed protein product [Paramecium sonneborni]|uniref:Uncharacterized protein n=1 Tax=Paramecium sonneborni TaxID=65129 RepID=A0A8S1R9Z7_9CILI|nr:unnamed protein product [Paramecium sonneborni]
MYKNIQSNHMLSDYDERTQNNMSITEHFNREQIVIVQVEESNNPM